MTLSGILEHAATLLITLAMRKNQVREPGKSDLMPTCSTQHAIVSNKRARASFRDTQPI